MKDQNELKIGANHKNQITKLKRAEGQIRGIINMTEDNRYCVDILTQLKAAKAALTRVEKDIITGHLNHCVRKAVKSKQKENINEMLDEINQLLKTARLS